MKTAARFSPFLFACLLLLTGCALFFPGCANPSKPEAVVYDTLQQAHNALRAKHQLFEVEVAAGKVPLAQERQVRESYRDALTAIRDAAAAASLGMNATTPEDVARLVNAYVNLVAHILPPPSANPPGN